MRQSKLAAAASLLAAADASGASGELTGLGRPLRLRARTERRHDQRSEGVDSRPRMVTGARSSMQEQRCAGKEGARGHACCAARWPIMVDNSDAISTEVSDSMSSEGAACSHLHEGREEGRGTDSQLDGRSGCKDGAERRGVPLYVYETASPHLPSSSIAALAHAHWLMCKQSVMQARRARRIRGRSLAGRSLVLGTWRVREGWHSMRRRTMRLAATIESRRQARSARPSSSSSQRAEGVVHVLLRGTLTKCTRWR